MPQYVVDQLIKGAPVFGASVVGIIMVVSLFLWYMVKRDKAHMTYMQSRDQVIQEIARGAREVQTGATDAITENSRIIGQNSEVLRTVRSVLERKL